ncbi:hypothetical protein M0813_06411 [Anaeramoeba flamelloides]|uniref:Uncharacterized protein n=1 Tax=Anaeramoeba flamelloides TaxID=1746091 RepID=A0ABQ8XDW6_9EUKA|nr:hypothetical protein M0813_06411 [Anaeramoeba flamelloides]
MADNPVVQTVQFLTNAAGYVCGFVALPVISYYHYSAKFVCGDIFSNEPSGNRLSHAFLWPLRILLILLGPCVFGLEIFLSILPGMIMESVAVQALSGILFAILIIIGIAWYKREDGRFKFLPDFELPIYLESCTDSALDFGAFFCFCFAVLGVVRWKALHRFYHDQTKSFRSRLPYEVPNTLFQFLLIPCWLLIFLCHWRWSYYRGEIKKAADENEEREIAMQQALYCLLDLPFYLLGFLSLLFFLEVFQVYRGL